MIPLFFGPADRRLFGVYQGAQRAPATTAALLCNPFGQEAVRAHRMYRVLGDRLSRAGFDVLRFDYYATGDSAGDDAEGDLAGWTGDLMLAHEELMRRSGAGRAAWMGLRLGATLAMKASAMLNKQTDQLILWEPIVDGPGYLEELGKRHLKTVRESYDLPDPAWMETFAPEDLGREAIGFELGDLLRAQLGKVHPGAFETPRAVRCDVIERAPPRPAVADLVRQWRHAGIETSELVLDHDFDWMAPEALSTALVPGEAIQLLSCLMTEAR